MTACELQGALGVALFEQALREPEPLAGVGRARRVARVRLGGRRFGLFARGL
jgi:hypothetical protein